MGRCPLCGFRGLLLAGLVFFAPAAFAGDVETRDFNVMVDGKRAGEAHMTIQSADGNTITMRCDTDIVVKIGPFKAYSYSYRGHETWKDGKLHHFESTCNDDGKRFAVSADVEGDRLVIRVNEVERKVSKDVWLTSYWQQPDARRIGPIIQLLDADCGQDFAGRLQLIGAEDRDVAGTIQTVKHYKLTGKRPADLWYDSTGRLVRQDWMEDGHRTQLELTQVRR